MESSSYCGEFCLFVFNRTWSMMCRSPFSEMFCRVPHAAWFNNLVCLCYIVPAAGHALAELPAWRVVIYRPPRWIFVDTDLFFVCCKAQRAEQARQELINQVRESAAKTLETIRGSYDFCRTLLGDMLLRTHWQNGPPQLLVSSRLEELL